MEDQVLSPSPPWKQGPEKTWGSHPLPWGPLEHENVVGRACALGGMEKGEEDPVGQKETGGGTLSPPLPALNAGVKEAATLG